MYFIYEIKKYWENFNTFFFCHLFAFFSCQLHGSRYTSQLNQEEQNWVRELHFRNRGVLRLQSWLLPLRVIGPDLPAGGLLGQAITRMPGYVCVGSLPTLYFSLFWLFIIANLWTLSSRRGRGRMSQVSQHAVECSAGFKELLWWSLRCLCKSIQSFPAAQTHWISTADSSEFNTPFLRFAKARSIKVKSERSGGSECTFIRETCSFACEIVITSCSCFPSLSL